MARPKEKIDEMKDILILYEEKDSQAWTDFIQDSFKQCPQMLSIEVKALRSNIDDIGALSACFSMVLVVVSHEMINTMESVAKTLNPILQNHSCVSVIKLFIEGKEYTKVRQCYKSAQKWREFSIAAGDDEDKVQKQISEIINVLETLNVPEQPAPKPPSPRKSRIMSICPDHVRQGGEMLTVVLRTKLHEGQCVQVSVGNSEKLMDTNQLNPYCFNFKAPAHKAGRADLRLFIDGKKITKMPVHYSSMTKFAYTSPEYLCQLIGLNPDDKTGLDKELTNIFNNSAPQDGSLQFLLTPKILQSTSTGGIEGCGELPTLLHFACKYGLNDLAVSIINTPGSHVAINMDNERGVSPLDLARETKNEELVNYLECFVEMHDYVTDIEDLYERMSGGTKKLEPYMNTGEATGVARPGYLSMGRQSVEEAYIEARVPSDDYEVTDTLKVPGGPEEVKEEDDVPPELPRRRATNKRSDPKVPDDLPLQREQRQQEEFEDFPPMPKDDFFAGPGALSPVSMGSSNLDELNEYAEAYKRGDFSLDDIEKLYKAWHERNRDANSSSLKERKKQLDELKDTYQSIVSLQKGKGKKSTFPWKKKEKQVDIDIQHHVKPNNYESWGIMTGSQSPRQYRQSTISNSSTTSSSSTSSRDSALGPVREISSESDTSDTEAPAVPIRRRSDKSKSEEKKENRQSWGEQFLNKVKNKPHSRLPKPPPTNPVYVKHRLPSTPERPPRPPTSSKPRHYTQ